MILLQLRSGIVSAEGSAVIRWAKSSCRSKNGKKTLHHGRDSGSNEMGESLMPSTRGRAASNCFILVSTPKEMRPICSVVARSFVERLLSSSV